MSGLSAIFHLSGAPADPEALRRMTDAAAHRGPDAARYWCEGPIGLGHRLLRTTPQAAAEVQPLVDDRVGLAITADLRLDNRDELMDQLRAHGLEPLTGTDPEIALLAYAFWGTDCAERLIGDFALAVWDRRRRTLFLARDPIGIKPLLYRLQGDLLLVASEPRLVFNYPGIRPEPHWPLVGDYLVRNHSEPEETFYAGVRRLRPGHSVLVRDSSFQPRRYWPSALGEIRYRRSEQYAEHFRDLFEEAVRCRLRTNTPAGILLSGGLDSSAVACVAQRLGPSFETISLVYPGEPCEETEYLDAVAAGLDVPVHRILYGEDFHEAARLERAPLFPDILFHPPAVAQLTLFSRCAHTRGIRVLLDGIGGDELFSSSPSRGADYVVAGDLPRLIDRLRTGRRLDIPLWRLLAQHSLWPLAPEGLKQVSRRLRLRLFPRSIPHDGPWMRPDFVALHRLHERAMAHRASPNLPFRSLTQRGLYDCFTRSHNMVFSNEWNNRMLSAHSLENRHPFLDRRLLDFCLAIPDTERLREGVPKLLLRNALHGILPEKIRSRESKVTFDCLVEEQVHRRQRCAIEHLFDGLKLESLGVLVPGQARALLDSSRLGNHWANATIISILELELWYDICF